MYKKLLNLVKASTPIVDDQTAARCMEAYPFFHQLAGTYQHEGTRCRYEASGSIQLYRLAQTDATPDGTYIAENWLPDITPAVWEAIDIVHAGTLDDPIPAARGMTYYTGKYYEEAGKVYFCQYGDVEPDGVGYTLAYLPSELVDQYFKAVA